jgi:hypothetical protein
MKVVRSLALVLGLWGSLSLPVMAHASKVIAGVSFDDRCEVGGQSLVLNGAGLRVKLIIKVYAMALYLPGLDHSVRTVLTQPGPKSIHIAMLRDVRADDLSEALVKGMVNNLNPRELLALQARLDDLHLALMSGGDAKRGDLIQLDYLPGAGSRITMAGKVVGHDIPGEDFYQGLLKIWLGEKASDNSLKSDLLGASSR